MDCPNWPPPLPSLPLYPPCVALTEASSPPTPEVKIRKSKTQEWWNELLYPMVNQMSGFKNDKKGTTYELTRKQRREMLPIKVPTTQDKLIWSVPFPEESYPRNGLPIWERLYLDRKLPMLKCPPNALIFARQKIGKKVKRYVVCLWKTTEGQEFILYDPHSYEMTFSYENIHDPHLTSYYEGKEIRGFLQRVGDATEDGWGLCSLKKFNQYRKYLKRVHLSLLHQEMERQEALKNEIHIMKEYKQTTLDTMNALERRDMMDEVRAAIVEALTRSRIEKINRILASIKEKENRVKKLRARKEKEKELRKQRGLELLAEQELKNKIALEIKRRKKIATLRRWHDTEEKIKRIMKKKADDKAREKAEKVLLKWQNKIESSKKMLQNEDEYLKLQEKVRQENIAVRKALNETLKQKQKERFQEIRKEGLRKKAVSRRKKEDKRMAKAITEAWIDFNVKDFDWETDMYRIKKSINSTMAELLSTEMQGPDRFSIILMARNRIQQEQKIPIQVSFAIDTILECSIQEWASDRLMLLLETVVALVTENGRKVLSDIKARYRDLTIEKNTTFKATNPRGRIYRPDDKKVKQAKKKKPCEQTVGSAMGEQELDCDFEEENEKMTYMSTAKSENNVSQLEESTKGPTAVTPNYVHFGEVTTYEYPFEIDPEEELKPTCGRPKTPMPTQEELCKAGFMEDKLNDVLPTLNDNVMDLKEKNKFYKTFQKVALELFKRSMELTKIACEPSTRFRGINKLIYLGDTEKMTQANIICSLVMNKDEKMIYESEEFNWLAKVTAREAILEVLNPPEFNKKEDDGVSRTKIMFYAPRKRKVKKYLR